MFESPLRTVPDYVPALPWRIPAPPALPVPAHPCGSPDLSGPWTPCHPLATSPCSISTAVGQSPAPPCPALLAVGPLSQAHPQGHIPAPGNLWTHCRWHPSYRVPWLLSVITVLLLRWNLLSQGRSTWLGWECHRPLHFKHKTFLWELVANLRQVVNEVQACTLSQLSCTVLLPGIRCDIHFQHPWRQCAGVSGLGMLGLN